MRSRRATPPCARRPFVALALASAGLCASAPPLAAAAQGSAELEAEVRRLVGSASCNADDQCRTLAFGAKACGGPASYLAWSTLVSDAAALQTAADRYAARRRAELDKEGRVSDCALVVDPGARCAPAADGARRCTVHGGARSGGGALR